MRNTMIIEVTNQKAVKLIHDLEDLKLIKVMKESLTDSKEVFLKELEEAVGQVNKATKGKVKLKSAQVFLDEL